LTNLLTDWIRCLAPRIDRIVPGTAHQAMLAVAVVEGRCGGAFRPLHHPDRDRSRSGAPRMTAAADVEPTARSHVADDGGALDADRARDAAEAFLWAPAVRVDVPRLAETPRRMANAYAELLTPRSFDLTTFPNADGYDELVLARHSGAVGVRPPRAAVHRRRSRRVPARRADRRTVQARPRRGAVRPAAAGAGAADRADRRLGRPPATPSRGRRGRGGRAPVHDAARRARTRGHDDHLGPAGILRDDARSRPEFLSLTPGDNERRRS
jgi:hypothetical protein